MSSMVKGLGFSSLGPARVDASGFNEGVGPSGVGSRHEVL